MKIERRQNETIANQASFTALAHNERYDWENFSNQRHGVYVCIEQSNHEPSGQFTN